MDITDFTNSSNAETLALRLHNFLSEDDVCFRLKDVVKCLYNIDPFTFTCLKYGLRQAEEEMFQPNMKALPAKFDPTSRRIRFSPRRKNWLSLSQMQEDTYIRCDVEGDVVRLQVISLNELPQTNPDHLIILPRTKYPSVYKDGVEISVESDFAGWMKGIAFFLGNCRDPTSNYKKDFFTEDMVVVGPENKFMGKLEVDTFIRPAEIMPHFAQDCNRHTYHSEFCRLCYIVYYKRFPVEPQNTLNLLVDNGQETKEDEVQGDQQEYRWTNIKGH